jgi:hypothetical protein
MADRLDVTTRLAEGQPAVDHLQTYVRACEAVGYQQPDLTARASQVGDWYQTEVGLDLRVLDGDITELRAAVTAIDEALWVQRTQVTELAAAWRGAGAESAARFVQRHCELAEEVSGHIRAAAEHCAVLRDDVWQAVDGKVATTVAIDDRSAAQRSTWLAAAQAVTAGDRSASEVVVHRQVMPFVDNDIRNDWLAGMSSANASIAGSYDTTIHALASMRDVRFDIPGDLGPSRQPEERPIPTAAPLLSVPTSPLPATSLPAGSLPTVPAAATVADPRPETAQPLPVDQPEEVPSAVTDPLGDAAGLSAGTGGLGGLGGMTGGIGGVVGSIVDGIGSLLGSLAGGVGNGPGIEDDPFDVDDGDDDHVLDGDDKPDGADDTAEPAGVDHTPVPEAAMPESAVAEKAPAATESVAEPVAQPVDAPPEAAPAADPPAAVAPPDGSTPCEIAEDQLPQAGQ